MIGQITAGTIGVLLTLVCGIKMWKDHGKRPPGWMALAAGLFSAGALVPLIGTAVDVSVLGVGVVAIVLVGCGTLFWIEVVKKHKPHKLLTPIASFAFGLAVAATFGGVQHAVNHGTSQLASIVQHHTGQ